MHFNYNFKIILMSFWFTIDLFNAFQKFLNFLYNFDILVDPPSKCNETFFAKLESQTTSLVKTYVSRGFVKRWQIYISPTCDK